MQPRAIVLPMRLIIILFLSTAELLAMVLPVLSWHEKHLMPEGVSGGASAVLSGQLIHAGGTTWRNQVKHWLADTLVYDPQKDAWTHGPSLPEPLAYGAFVRTPHSLEVLGGASDAGVSRKCWRLDADSKKWIACGQLPSGSLFGTGAILHGGLYLLGGCEDMDLSVCSSSVLRRNHSGTWEKVSEMPDGAIAMSASAELHNQLYLFGGSSHQSSSGVRNRNEALRYDPQSNHWTVLRSLPIAARGMTAVPLNNHELLVAGGYTDSASGFSDAAFIYDTIADRYTPATPLPLAAMGMEMVPHERSIWALGGEDKPRHRNDRLFETNLP
jgi:N-acetylneuraminic acid mutarotase